MQLTRTPALPNLRILRSSDDGMQPSSRTSLMDCLLANRISVNDLKLLRLSITPDELSIIIQRIYDLNEKYILELSTVDGVLRRLNQIKNSNRNKAFTRKIKAGFRELSNPDKKVILAEGDSWFNYPILLTDLVDRIRMERDFALYSLASGGDWFLNMLSGREYIEELSLIHPDVFLISGGGNDLVGSRRLAAIVDPSGRSQEYEQSDWAKNLVKNANQTHVLFDKDKFEQGCRYLSKDFFALLMFFHLQYYYLINNILRSPDSPGKFSNMKIITQGYDYALPSHSKSFGKNPLNWYVPFVRMFLGHGGWLKTPLLLRGVPDRGETHANIVYAMIYLFNEMTIEIGNLFAERGQPQVFHIDSRGTVGKHGWADELHARPEFTLKIGERFIQCIRGDVPTYSQVYVVTDIKSKDPKNDK